MTRRILSSVLLTVLLLAVLAPSLAGDMQQGSMYVNTANGKALRFRSSRSTRADNVLTEIPYGTKVYVLNWDGTWARIRYNSAVGYVVKKHLSIGRPEDYSVVAAQKAEEKTRKQQEQELRKADAKLDHSKVKKVAEYDVTVFTGVKELKVKLYQKASLTADVTAEYEEGTRLSVQAQNRDWAKVYDGSADVTGYMLLEDLEQDVMEEEILDDE